jgi:hypothetical protein
LVGENWWTKWPDELMDAEPWVRGDVFDAVMHYQWFKYARALCKIGTLKTVKSVFFWATTGYLFYGLVDYG